MRYRRRWFNPANRTCFEPHTAEFDMIRTPGQRLPGPSNYTRAPHMDQTLASAFAEFAANTPDLLPVTDEYAYKRAWQNIPYEDTQISSLNLTRVVHRCKCPCRVGEVLCVELAHLGGLACRGAPGGAPRGHPGGPKKGTTV